MTFIEGLQAALPGSVLVPDWPHHLRCENERRPMGALRGMKTRLSQPQGSGRQDFVALGPCLPCRNPGPGFIAMLTLAPENGGTRYAVHAPDGTPGTSKRHADMGFHHGRGHFRGATRNAGGGVAAIAFLAHFLFENILGGHGGQTAPRLTAWRPVAFLPPGTGPSNISPHPRLSPMPCATQTACRNWHKPSAADRLCGSSSPFYRSRLNWPATFGRGRRMTRTRSFTKRPVPSDRLACFSTTSVAASTKPR